jgi:glutamine amidotransferase
LKEDASPRVLKSMCRLVGIVASEITKFGLVLKEAPRSLARLSHEHPDGWGVAAYGGPGSLPPPSEGCRHDGGWRVHKGVERASECEHFQAVASRSAGTILIAHIRQKTVGPTRIENTHPFMQGGWVFAHNGTIKDQDFVRAGASGARLAEVVGDTDSEVLFAFFLTRLDQAGITRTLATDSARETAMQVMADATAELRARNVGAFNFLLSNGSSCFVHRFGRSLFLLERRPDPPQSSATSLDEQAALAKWRMRRPAVLVASERLTDEPWRELPEGTLLRVDRDPVPSIAWPQPERVAS